MAEERSRRLKFYRDLTPEVKWEFINGEIVVHSPVPHRHTQAVQHLFKLLDSHAHKMGIGTVCIEKALCSFPRNDYEPDVVFFGLAKSSLIGPDTLRYPVPDFVVEVLSPGTQRHDRVVKKQDYAAHGVAEYWIIDPVAETVEIFRASGGIFPLEVPAIRSGIIASEAVAGFSVPIRAIFDSRENLEALRELLAE